MNVLLMKHRPKDTPKEDWEKHWNNAHPTLQPLADAIKEMQEPLEKVVPNDFNCPNHYAKMVYEAARKQALQDVLNLLPNSCSK